MKKVFILCLLMHQYVYNSTQAQTVYIPNGLSGIGSSTNANVGIGTSSPQEKLHVNGNLKLEGNAGIIFNRPDTNDPYNYIVFRQQDETKWLIDYGTQQTSNLRFVRFSGGQQDSFLNFDYDNFEFEILNTRVGIGTSSPAHQLHLKDPSGGSALGLERNGKLWRFDLDYTEAGKLYISHTDKSNVLVLSRGGNIGIGTADPDTDSKLTVAGKIHAWEVKVTVNAGSDHVFKNNYQIPDLEKLEAFIHKNKHLPEIAPEQEMLENGVEVGEFQIKLLQKIEELTLYIIDQNKSLKEVIQKNQKLEERIKTLEK